MTKRGALLLLDSSMLLFFAILMSWQLSGVIAHEWIGLALIAMIVLHLLVHWAWVESTVSSTVKHPRRSRVIPLLLNAGLFATMGLALISGIIISKVVFPNTLTPDAYMQWHELHELGSNLTLVILALHVALNWDRIRSSLRTGFRAGRGRIITIRPAVLARRFAWIVAVSALLTGSIWLKVRLFPEHPQIMRVYADGRRELVSPPPEFTRIRRGTERPSTHGTGRFLVSSLALAAIAVAGRRVLKLRLNGRPDGEKRMPLTA